MSTSETLYTARLKRFRSAIASLPSKLPSGSLVYNFSNWTPDPQLLEDYGSPCSVLNATLESTFGLRGQSSIVFTERGPGLDSLANVLEHYLTGDYTETVVIGKWLDDLIAAAEGMSTEWKNSNFTDQTSFETLRRPKVYNEWIESTQEEKSVGKQQKTSAAAKAKERASLIEKTAQECNWKHGFDDLVDVKDEPKLYTTGRKG
ncbi:hypothetical protein FRC07_010272 [Ceratobasidium sp. 392]|nr:hypothetical protein FRC07_010272 [Ceratobasidium sp. 392]